MLCFQYGFCGLAASESPIIAQKSFICEIIQEFEIAYIINPTDKPDGLSYYNPVTTMLHHQILSQTLVAIEVPKDILRTLDVFSFNSWIQIILSLVMLVAILIFSTFIHRANANHSFASITYESFGIIPRILMGWKISSIFRRNEFLITLLTVEIFLLMCFYGAAMSSDLVESKSPFIIDTLSKVSEESSLVHITPGYDYIGLFNSKPEYHKINVILKATKQIRYQNVQINDFINIKRQLTEKGVIIGPSIVLMSCRKVLCMETNMSSNTYISRPFLTTYYTMPSSFNHDQWYQEKKRRFKKA